MSQLKEGFERLFNSQIPVSVIGGVVTAVRPEEDTCDVQPDSDDAEVHDVALLNGIYPAVGAQVLIGLVENRLVDTFLISADQVTHFRYTTEKESLHTLLTDLVAEVRRLKFATNAGPTVQLLTDPAWALLASRIDNLLLP